MRQNLKALTGIFVTILMAFAYGTYVNADSADASDNGDDTVETITVEETMTVTSDYDNDELAEQYILSEMSDDDDVCYAVYNYASVLSTDNAAAYNYIKSQISKIAAGDITSTVITLPEEFSYTFTASELGISNLRSNVSEMKTKVAERLPINRSEINQALLNSCPFDLYWFDKEIGSAFTYDLSYNASSVTVSGFTFKYVVEQEYRYSNNQYIVDSKYGQSVKTASSNANSIINTYAALNDYDKLLAYNDKICDLVEYNHTAADDDSIPYGNPWQLVWVFDGDSSTNVVCEGYAKAFKYLCDKSTFNDVNLYVLTVSGVVQYSSTNSGGHMWNIVHIGGNNYIVDVTNNDIRPNDYFLIGATGSVYGGYYLADGSYYPYKQKTLDFYPESALAIASTDYVPTIQPDTVALTSGLAHVQDIGNVGYSPDASGVLTLGTTGMGKRLEEITIGFVNTTAYSGSLQYRVHVQDLGWLDWVDAGQPAGTEGMSKRIEAIEIRLTGDLAKYYSVVYCVHIEDYGDAQGWVHDGALAGTTGESKRIEQIMIKILPIGADSSMSVKYRVHVQDFGWEGSYASDGAMSGTSGQSKRLEGIEIFLSGCQYSGGIKYKTHVQNIGWESSWSQDGEMSGTQGQALRLEGIQIELYGEVAEYYDIYYRVHAQDIGWLSWAKNGECAGTAGRSARLEGIQIVLVPKGSPAPSDTYCGITSVTSVAFVEGF